MATEISLNLIKPDALTRRLVGKIISRFEERNLSLVDMKYVMPDEALIRAMYLDKQTYGIFDELLAYMLSGPSIAMVWEGEDANNKARQIIGVKDPIESDAGTIRGSMADNRVRSLVHGSRSPEEALNEARLWFPERYPGANVPAADELGGLAPKSDDAQTERVWSWDGADEAELVR